MPTNQKPVRMLAWVIWHKDKGCITYKSLSPLETRVRHCRFFITKAQAESELKRLQELAGYTPEYTVRRVTVTPEASE